MGAVVDLDRLLDQRRVWRGRQAQARPLGLQPTGHTALDERLPEGGWPVAALSELLLASPGCGELQLLWPTLARLSADASRVVLVAPPFIPYAPAWQAAGVDLRWLVQVDAEPADALWAAEQCLRSGSCAAVLCWPKPVRHWHSPAGRSRRRTTLHLQRCALPLTRARRNGVC